VNDYVKLILDKNYLNVKLFMFECILCKSGFSNEFKTKIKCRSQ